MEILVVGGGIIGSFAAYYLRKGGHSVTVVDKSPDGAVTSVNSAGLIVPSLSPEPPIGLGKILTTCLTHHGSVYVSPREIFKHATWMSRARAEQSPTSQRAILELSKKSLQLYTEFFKVESVEVDRIEGIATLYNDAIEARQTAQLLNARFIDDGEVSELGFKGFGGGVIHERELSINPAKLLKSLQRKLIEAGVNIIHATATNLQGSPPKVTSVVANERTLKADAYVVAGGSWSSKICRSLGFNPQVLPARGMAMVFDSGGVEITRIPALFEDYGTVVVQHNRDLVRITGFFDLVGFSNTYKESRKRWLLHVAREHVQKYGEMSFVEESIGYRPCTPDRLPIIGRVPGYSNLYIASGHCRIGITLAPVTGYALKCMIGGEECPIDLNSFTPSRFA